MFFIYEPFVRFHILCVCFAVLSLHIVVRVRQINDDNDDDDDVQSSAAVVTVKVISTHLINSLSYCMAIVSATACSITNIIRIRRSLF